jgi:SAM-dependent methyltransferase/predicted transcriptional regulator
MGLTARDIMTPLDECVADSDTLLEASRRWARLRFTSMPIILRDGRVRGSLRPEHVVLALLDGRHPAEIEVAEVSEIRSGDFTPHAVAVSAGCSVDAVARTMKEQEVDHVLVKEGETLIGVVVPEDIQASTFTPPDGLPLPPPELMRVVMGATAARRRLSSAFYATGAQVAENITRILGRHGVDLSDLGAILDFGCGGGRVIRHWKSLAKPRLHGCDYNPSLVEWCRHNLPFAEFVVNDLAPPLPYADDSFDFIHAHSVFTHLGSELQTAWIAELERVLRPNGMLLLTVHGKSYLSHLDTEQRKRFHAGELVVMGADESGADECAAFHPERYIYETLARDLSVVTIVPGSKNVQDVVLLQNTRS